MLNDYENEVESWFKKMNWSENKSKLSSGFIGLAITLFFLFIEALIIKNYRKNVVNISKYIYKTPKKLNFK